MPSESPLGLEYLDDPFLTTPLTVAGQQVSPVTKLPFSVSSPKVSQLFNVFHPSDPIAYRLEPLISPAMSSLKPQTLPYTKKGIFGNVAPQGLTGIGTMVGQSVSGLFSSLTGGIANTLLNRSLGLSNEDVARIAAAETRPVQPQQVPGSGTDPGVVSDIEMRGEKANERKRPVGRRITEDTRELQR